MDATGLNESAWARSKRDTRAVLGTTRFFLGVAVINTIAAVGAYYIAADKGASAEVKVVAVGGAVLIGPVILAALVWLVCWITAPIRQRNDARDLIREADNRVLQGRLAFSNRAQQMADRLRSFLIARLHWAPEGVRPSDKDMFESPDSSRLGDPEAWALHDTDTLIEYQQKLATDALSVFDEAIDLGLVAERHWRRGELEMPTVEQLSKLPNLFEGFAEQARGSL